MGKSTAQEYCERYVGLISEIDGLWEQIKRARNSTQIPAMRQGDGSQRTAGSTGDQLGSKVIHMMGVEERLLPRIEAKHREMEAIEDAIDSIDDPKHRRVLWLRYIDCDGLDLTKWEVVAMDMWGKDDPSTVRRATRLHGRALQSLAKVLEDKAQKESHP